MIKIMNKNDLTQMDQGYNLCFHLIIFYHTYLRICFRLSFSLSLKEYYSPDLLLDLL